MTRKATETAPTAASQINPLQTATDLQTPASGLPSEHIRHSTVLRAELENRLSQFVSAIAAIQAEADGQHATYESELSDLNTKHEEAVSELTQRHDTSKANLLRRIQDLQAGQLMLTRALDTEQGS